MKLSARAPAPAPATALAASRLTLAAVVLLVAATTAWLLLPPRQSEDVDVPASGAAPEEVVTAFIEALDAHDCATAGELLTARAGVGSWCGAVAGLEDVRVGEATLERPEWSGRSAGDEVVHVPVTFDLDWRPFRGDGSMPEGPTTWGYLLVRTTPEGPWRITGQGPV